MIDSAVNNYLNIDKSVSCLIPLFMAIILAAIIAFHPRTFSNKQYPQGIEVPKNMILYAMIASLVGYIITDYGSELGLIFFGLGGLMRFRTNMKTSTQTGHLILVTLIGLCCGLEKFQIAVLSTILAWILIYFLEQKTIYQLEIKGIKSEEFLELIESYRYVLQQKKCKIITKKKNQSKSKVSFTFSSAFKLDRDSLEKLFHNNAVTSNCVSISCSIVD